MIVDISQSPNGSPNRIMHDLGYTKRREVNAFGNREHIYERGDHVLRFRNVDDIWDYLDGKAGGDP